jgi:hypothetical protein
MDRHYQATKGGLQRAQRETFPLQSSSPQFGEGRLMWREFSDRGTIPQRLR